MDLQGRRLKDLQRRQLVITCRSGKDACNAGGGPATQRRRLIVLQRLQLRITCTPGRRASNAGGGPATQAAEGPAKQAAEKHLHAGQESLQRRRRACSAGG